ncbi:hypothetical protein [Ferrovibrio sp.]|uniref:hypothetical protein n=1 Tax=Ferrovibrio sp. TaxID=1917215 RepID=UPI0025C0E109|nr:hypothetical protein [Ferrovibrio sp.]MBX3456381.1 hypothetical protein [Ferrovibrio sp.]
MTTWIELTELVVTKTLPLIGPSAVGAVAALASNWFLEGRKQKHESRSLAFALAAEIEEGIAMSVRRQYEQFFKGILPTLKQGVDVRISEFVGAEPDPIFSSNIGKIGILGPELAAEVVRYHSLTVGIRRDIQTLARLPIQTDPRLAQVQAIHKANLIEEDLRLWEEVKDLARSVTQTLRK